MEIYRDELLTDCVGYPVSFCQENISKSKYGVLRGLHYQTPPFAQSKLIRVLNGLILDVAVDIRQESENFGNYISVELSSENKKALFIPKGFAHGFVVLSHEATIAYSLDNYYNPGHENGILYNDPHLNIDWKINNSKIIVSEKDNNLPLFKNAKFS